MKLSKADARRALVAYHFAPCADLPQAFERLRSIQFDPIAPIGCNHDLVLQARVPEYRIGAWEKAAYEDRLIYDGWDKQASLVPFEGWPIRRIFHQVHRPEFEKKIFIDHKDAVEQIMREITEKGPLMPRQFDFQQRREEWKVSWHGPSVTKQTLRALWHSGLIMTSGRRSGQHLYDLTERVMPPRLFSQPLLPHQDAVRELVMERHRAMGLVRPSAPPEIWSFKTLTPTKKAAIDELLSRMEVTPVEVEGTRFNATSEFLSFLDQPSLEPEVRFIAPLDQFMWDRKAVAHLFDFDYIWEIYTPEAKRKWGYYVLPILFGTDLVARAEFSARAGILDLRQWHIEPRELDSRFWPALEIAVPRFMRYCSSTKVRFANHIPAKVRDVFKAAAKLNRSTGRSVSKIHSLTTPQQFHPVGGDG